MRALTLTLGPLLGAALGCAERTAPPGPPQTTPGPEINVTGPDAPPAPSTAETAARPSDPRVQTIGRSIRGAAIEMHTLGRGPVETLIFAGIHGDERNSAELAELLVAHLRANPAAGNGRGVAIIPRANPDGLARGTRGNANGVDLNRNFPASNWRPAGRGRRHGTHAASEPETRALIAVMERLRPARIVSIHAIHGGRECNNFDGPARHLAERMTALNGYPTKASIGYPTPGSFGSWAGIDRRIPTVTLELPRSRTGRQCWPQQRAALLAVIGAGG